MPSRLQLIVVRTPVPPTATIVEAALDDIPFGWYPVFSKAREALEFVQEVIGEDEVKLGMISLPNRCDLFNAFHAVPLNKVRLVIVGQDPYPALLSDGRTRAVGRSFSVRRGDEVPASLVNIYKEIARSIPDFRIPNHGDLSGWEQQGVLLLNTALTVPPGMEGRHSEYGTWLTFMRLVFDAIAETNPRCIYFLWGAKAQKIAPLLGERAIIFTASHPSPRSVHISFQGCGHFISANRLLMPPIDWNLP